MSFQNWFSAAGDRRAQKDSLFHCLVQPDVFSEQLTPAQKRQLFKGVVSNVEFEPHAFCNRVCSFCPNSHIDRRSNRQVLSPQVYTKVLTELQEIGYGETITFARYSEPMARDEIFGMVEEARRKLPNAYLKLISNGDYLTPEKIDRLKTAGLNFLPISLYLPESTPWTREAAMEQLLAFSERVQLGYRIRRLTATGLYADFIVDGMKMNARCLNFGIGKHGVDRGMSVDWMTDSEFVRKDPCSFVFRNFTMDYDGNVMPCCNLRSDIAEHRQFILGNVTGSSIFDIYADQKFIDWRRSLAGFSEKAGPCRHCKDAPLASLTDRLAVAIWDKTHR